MAKCRILLAFFGAATVGAANADPIVVAEFRADEGLSAAESATPSNPDRDLYYPSDLYAKEIGGSEERSWSIGRYTFSGVLDWGQRASYWAGERYSDEQYFSLGSKVVVGDSSETYVYHGYGRDRLDPSSDLYDGFGDSDMIRTGVAQTLYFADQLASVGVGYEYASGDREELYEGREGHEINVSGQFQLGWGVNAHLEAGYGLYSYGEYEGIRGNLNSARTNMRAAISRSFTESLSWGMHYSYVDEEFEPSRLSESRQTWGLNLEYRY